MILEIDGKQIRIDKPYSVKQFNKAGGKLAEVSLEFIIDNPDVPFTLNTVDEPFKHFFYMEEKHNQLLMINRNTKQPILANKINYGKVKYEKVFVNPLIISEIDLRLQKREPTLF